MEKLKDYKCGQLPERYLADLHRNGDIQFSRLESGGNGSAEEIFIWIYVKAQPFVEFVLFR